MKVSLTAHFIVYTKNNKGFIMISYKAQENFKRILTSCDLVRTISYAMFSREDLNISKMMFINKCLVFGTGESSNFDVRSHKDWAKVNRYIKRQGSTTKILVPIMENKQLKNGKVIKVQKGFRDSNSMISYHNTYGDFVFQYKKMRDKSIDLETLAIRWNVSLGELPKRVEVVSYYNESKKTPSIASVEMKRFIYNIAKIAVKQASFKHQPAKDKIVVELTTLALLRSMGQVVLTDIDYHQRIDQFIKYQRYSTLAGYFSIIKGVEKTFEAMELAVTIL